MKTGDIVKVAPELTGQNRWIDGEVINVRKNPFVGTEIAIKDHSGTIFFGPEIYFVSTTTQSYVRNSI
jgi:hypothetical protein